MLRRQEEAAAALGFLPMVASEIEFYLFQDTYEEAYAKGYKGLTPHSPWLEDYHILQTTKDEYIIGAIRRGLEAAGVPCEFSKGEAGRGQHEMNLDYTTAVEMADRNSVYKTAAKEIAPLNGRVIASWPSTTSRTPVRRATCTPACGRSTAKRALMDDHHAEHGMSDIFRQYLAGLIATAQEFSLLWAPTVNSYKRFQPGSWAPTGIGWGIDNRTLGFRKVGHGERHPGRVPNPRERRQQLLRLRRPDRRRALRDPPQARPPAPFDGNGYDEHDLPRIPWNLPDAIDLWEASTACQGVLRRGGPLPPADDAPARSGWPSTAASPTGSWPATSNAPDRCSLGSRPWPGR